MNDTAQMTTSHSESQTSRPTTPTPRPRAITPAVDVFEDVNGITLWVDLPGVPRDKLDVRMHDDKLFIEGEAVVPVSAEMKLQYSELRIPRYARSFTVSQDFNTEAIDANLTEGVLKLSIPRREEAKPRRIEVTVN